MPENSQSIVESYSPDTVVYDRTESGGYRIRVENAIVANVVNDNRRIYPRTVLEDALARLTDRYTQGGITGEAEHPSKKGSHPNWLNTVVVWQPPEWNGDAVNFRGIIPNTTAGKDAIALIEAGIKPGVSLRGEGNWKVVTRKGVRVKVIENIVINALDLVSDPAFKNRVIQESMDDMGDQGNLAIKEKARQEVIAELNQVREAEAKAIEEKKRIEEEQQAMIQRAVAEQNAALYQALGVTEGADVVGVIAQRNKEIEELRRKEKVQAVEEHVETSITSKPYSDKQIQGLFREAVLEDTQGLMSIEEANEVIDAVRVRYNRIAAMNETRMRGLRDQARAAGYHVNPVIEETGTPAFAAASYAINESVGGQLWDSRTTTHSGEVFAARLLAEFDRRHQHYLQQETRILEESNMTMDLELPYSISRLLIQRVYPQLIAARIFDFGMAQGSPETYHYEEWMQDTEIYVDVKDEQHVINEGDAWYPLDNSFITLRSETVRDLRTNMIIKFGLDYTLDYEGVDETMPGARILILKTGPNVSSFPLRISIDYKYDQINREENSHIEQGKMIIRSGQMRISPMELATKISHEAIVLSRSQLGYDLVQKNITNLVHEITKKVETTAFSAAILAATRHIDNIPMPIWRASGGDSVEDLVKLIGYARTMVLNRNYTPTTVLCSYTTASVLAELAMFRDMVGVTLGENGLARSVKGLRVESTNLFPDDMLLVLDPGIVIGRVLEPMTINNMGYASVFMEYPRGSGKYEERKTSTQYWGAREMNGRATPVPGKAAAVLIQ